MSSPKAALCFIISYDHVLHKEDLWRDWIAPNQDIINVYFFYKDYEKIKSPWIKQHALPPAFICKTTYTNIVPAYLGLMMFALKHDTNNEWFCFLTDSCAPIVSPLRFRTMFFGNFKKTIMSWRPAWWNLQLQKRANLALLPKCLQLAHDPYFILNRPDTVHVLSLIKNKNDYFRVICEGGIANESLFAICLNIAGTLKGVVSEVTHITDWSRMTSPTSPWLFKHQENEAITAHDLAFIERELDKNRGFKFFIRKVANDFPDEALEHFMYEKFMDIDLKPEPKKKNWNFIIMILSEVVFLLVFFYLIHLVAQSLIFNLQEF